VNWRCLLAICLVALTCLAASQQVYEDDRISVAVPQGWSVTSVYPSNAGVPTVFIGDTTHNQPIGTALTRGKYTLYLLTHHGQASGIRGGRFGEVAEYVAPWVDRTNPRPCISSLQEQKIHVTTNLSRVDLYFDSASASADAQAQCGLPPVKAVLWYGSYFTETCPLDLSPDCQGFFLNYPLLAGKSPDLLQPPESQMSFSISYRAARPDDLPGIRDAQLNDFLAQATEVVRHIKFK
jgi:hypothetical protein